MATTAICEQDHDHRARRDGTPSRTATFSCLQQGTAARQEVLSKARATAAAADSRTRRRGPDRCGLERGECLDFSHTARAGCAPQSSRPNPGTGRGQQPRPGTGLHSGSKVEQKSDAVSCENISAPKIAPTACRTGRTATPDEHHRQRSNTAVGAALAADASPKYVMQVTNRPATKPAGPTACRRRAWRAGSAHRTFSASSDEPMRVMASAA